MRDEEVSQIVLFLEFLQEVDDLGLNGHVQGGDRFVSNNELGADGQGPGHADALPLAPAELVRETVSHVGVQPHVLQQVGDSLPVLVPSTHEAVNN